MVGYAELRLAVYAKLVSRRRHSEGESAIRLTLTLTVLLLLAVYCQADAPAQPAKQIPTDDVIIKLCGDTLTSMFARCGTPVEIFVNDDKQAIVGSGQFGFRVKEKTVTGCCFFQSWTGSFKGSKCGDSKDQAVKTLGGTYKEIKGKDFDAFGWKLAAQKSTFWLYFKNDKANYPQVVLDD